MKAITTRSGVAYEGPSIPTNPSPKKVVERETEETTDKEQTNFQGSTAQIPPPVIPISIPEPDVLTTLPKTIPIPESDIPKSLPKPNIPYPSRRDDQKSRDKASNQMEKIFQIFQDLRFDISFADALLLMPRFAPTIKSLLMNKEKLLELAKIPLNENCSAMLLKKLPEKLGDPGKFLIPCKISPGMTGRLTPWNGRSWCEHKSYASFFWKKLSLPELTPTRMTLSLAVRINYLPKEVTEAPILVVVPDLELPFETHVAASDFAIVAVHGTTKIAFFRLVHYASTQRLKLKFNTLPQKGKCMPEFYISKECQLNKRGNFSRTLNIISGMILIFFILVRIKSFDGVCMGKKLLRSSKLAMKDPPGAIIVLISPPKLYECRLALPTDIRDANMGRHNDQIDWWMTVKRQGKFHNEMRCFKTQSKFVKSDDLSILLVPFSIFRGNKYILVAVDYLRNGLNSKGLPTK
ncbi:hypothetical protein Tco_0270299 [Tanacetum coccineum]